MIYLVTRVQRALVALLPLLVIACLPAVTACSACPPRGPSAVRIDPAFTAEQRDAIEAAVYAWDDAAQLTIVVSSWDDDSAIRIRRVDSIVEQGKLGNTIWQSTDKSAREVQLASQGTLAFNYGDVSEYDFESTAVHELGHLLGLATGGCDGVGHSCDDHDAMYIHGDRSGARHMPTQNDVERVRAVVDGAW